MLIRALTNGNELDVPEDQAEALVSAGIYEYVKAAPDPEPEADADEDDDSEPKPKRKRNYKRRDLKADE